MSVDLFLFIDILVQLKRVYLRYSETGVRLCLESGRNVVKHLLLLFFKCELFRFKIS